MDIYKLKWTVLEQEIFSLLCYMAGERLSQREIAKKLKVSPTAVANSLKKLKKENMITVEKIKTFEEYIQRGIIKKISRDNQRAKSLIIESERKMNSLKEKLEKISIKNENANDFVEYCYDIMMIRIRAKLLLEGYSSSGQGAHEAEVSYTKHLGLNDNDIQFLDQIRYYRNGILYYGTQLDKEYAEKVIQFINKIYPKLKNV